MRITKINTLAKCMPSQQLEHKDTVGGERATPIRPPVNQLAIFHLLQTQHMDPRRPVFTQRTKNIYTVFGFFPRCVYLLIYHENIGRIEEIRKERKTTSRN